MNPELAAKLIPDEERKNLGEFFRPERPWIGWTAILKQLLPLRPEIQAAPYRNPVIGLVDDAKKLFIALALCLIASLMIRFVFEFILERQKLTVLYFEIRGMDESTLGYEWIGEILQSPA